MDHKCSEREGQGNNCKLHVASVTTGNHMMSPPLYEKLRSTQEKWKEARSPEQIGNMGERRRNQEKERDKKRIKEDMGEQEG